MARLCLVLGILCAVGFQASGDTTVSPTTIITITSIQTTIAPTTLGATSAATSAASTISSVPNTLTTVSSQKEQATTARVTTITSLNTTPSPAVALADQTSPTAKTTITPSGAATTPSRTTSTTKTENSVVTTSTTIKSDVPTTAKEEPAQAGTTRPTAQSSVTSTTAQISKQSTDTKPTKDIEINTTGESPSSPPLVDTSPSATSSHLLESVSSAIFKTTLASSDIGQTSPVQSTGNDHIQPIQVKCINNSQNMDKKLKLQLNASRICNNFSNNTQLTEEEQKAFDVVCKALNPEVEETKFSCRFSVAENEGELFITDAFVEKHVDQAVLYKAMESVRKEGDGQLYPEDVVSIPLISAIVSLAVALLIIAAIYGCYHQRQTRKREQRLTEELQTMENGYHDNPTLEVMETSPEMQEKKGGPNGELGDSWIVPLDNLTREDLEEEEDTHL